MQSAVYLGRLAHARHFPKKNAFAYGVFMMYLDLDELDELDRRFRLFSRNRFNVFSFYDRDHFKFLKPKNEVARRISRENVKYHEENYRDLDTRGRIELLLEEAGLNIDLGRVRVLTNPRVFGYVFNPVSFYYCFDRQGKLRALVSEVNNTFGDQKVYLASIDDPEVTVHSIRHQKNFYISPFTEYDNQLAWQFTRPGDKLLMIVDSQKSGKSELTATFVGERREFSGRLLAWLNLRYPLLTLMIIIRIHYQALRLFLKKVRFHDKSAQDKKIAKEIGG